VRFHPQWLSVRERVRAGELGDVRAIQSYFSYTNRDASNIRNQADIGGGALYDIGCYPIVTARFLFGCEPLRVIALVDRDPAFKTDRMVSALLDFGNGRRLDFTVSTQCVPYQRVQVCGTAKRIEIQIPFNAPLGGATDVLTDDGKRLDLGSTVSETIPACDMYTLEIDAFSQAVRGTIPLPYGVEDAILNMRVIDALFASEQTGAWVAV
jgi:predicted dehydrogenase